MPASDIVIKGAREHNLRDVNLVLPRNKLICLTGVSGSGKSSLAFDTLYAEGQRRYVESLSSFARQFLGQMPKPEVDHISGLSPSISISQKSTGTNPRSTVGTVTEIYDFLRVLYARVGQGYCPECGQQIAAQTSEQIVGRILQLPPDTRFLVLAPLIQRQKGEHRDLFVELRKQGFSRARVDGEIVSLSDELQLDRQMRHDVEVVIDRLANKPQARVRIAEAVELAIKFGKGTLVIQLEDSAASGPVMSAAMVAESVQEEVSGESGEPESGAEGGRGRRGRVRRTTESRAKPNDIVFSTTYACPGCGLSFPPPTPQLFSFNSPQGMCPECDGLGERFSFAPDLLIPNPKLSFRQGAIATLESWKDLGRWRRHIYQGVADTMERLHGLPAGHLLDTPWKDLDPRWQKVWLDGTGDQHITFTWRGGSAPLKYGGKFGGIVPELLTKHRTSKSAPHQRMLEHFMRTLPCSACSGQRLNRQARSVRITSNHPLFASRPPLSLPEVCELAIRDAVAFFRDLELDAMRALIATEVLKEIRGRLGFLMNVGLDYLTLARTAPTLSGGESQRIRLASQIGAGLVGVLYILDEPAIVLHARDNQRLIDTLCHLRDMGNTVVVVEHDEDTMRASDHLIDFGPGPGVRGGEVVAAGPPETVMDEPRSVTGRFLLGSEKIEVPAQRRARGENCLRIVGARHNNLKNVTAEIPLGNFVCVTGVSGSGKSSLINDILVEALHRDLNHGEGSPGLHDTIEGLEHLDKLISIDQSPIGRTPRSNPGTYIKVFDDIRSLYTQLPDSKRRGFSAGRFSFNVTGGRCEACEGNGSNKLEMDFLADVWVTCPVCEGHRYDRETLKVKFKDRSIAEILEMDVQQLLELFENVPKIRHKLQTLHDVGLDYIKLGQPSPTLSGGEAQRIKLAKELVKKSTGQTLYLLDEPTTGLHFADIKLLLKVLHGFVDDGNTVLVVEHNLDVLKTADWIIDLGPEGGAAGGQIMAVGTPEQIAQTDTYTGRALAELFGMRTKPVRSSAAASRTTAGEQAEVSGPVTSDESARMAVPRRGAAKGAAGSGVAAKNARSAGDRQADTDSVELRSAGLAPEERRAAGRSTAGLSPTANGSQAESMLASSASLFTASLAPLNASVGNALVSGGAYASERSSGTMAAPGESSEPLSRQWISVRGAQQHNLKGVDIDVVRDSMTVFCGPSGSGKSSLAMDTIYAEGQRRYVESLSAYARQFVAQMQKPIVEHIDGLSPAIAIEQKNFGQTPRSTVGTVTEIYDYLRILLARLGQPYCPDCDHPVSTQTVDQIVDQILAHPEGTRLYLLAPLDSDSGREYKSVWEELRAAGFARVRIDGQTFGLDKPPELDRKRKHKVEVLIDRVVVRADARSRIADSCETALAFGRGVMLSAIAQEDLPETRWQVVVHSQHLACRNCNRSFEPLTPHRFSFNSQLGWCPDCLGLGVQTGANPAALLRDPKLSLAEGAVELWPNLANPVSQLMLATWCRETGVPLDTPFEKLNARMRRLIMHGTGEQWFELRQEKVKKTARDLTAPALFRFQYKGLYPALEEASKFSPSFRAKLETFVDQVECSACGGSRLRDDAAAARLKNLTIDEICRLPLQELLETVRGWKFAAREKKVAGELIREVSNRLEFLCDVGLGYLTLSRGAATLSNGEAQRIRLASQLGSGLCGVLYVLDEPTIGLHPRDNTRLLAALHKLRDLGNTLLVVEHDREVIEGSDYICDFGPAAGKFGGQVVAQGPPRQLGQIEGSVTGPYLSGAKAIPIPAERRPTGLEPYFAVATVEEGAAERAVPTLVPEKGSKKKTSTAKPPRLLEVLLRGEEPTDEMVAPLGNKPPTGSAGTKSPKKANSSTSKTGKSGVANGTEETALPSAGPKQVPAQFLRIVKASHNNLRNVTVDIPLGTLTVVTGPSGSGKSSLVEDVLYASLAKTLHRANTTPGAHEQIQGIQLINKVIRVDQQPLGNSPASNPATYTGAFDLIRELFAQLPESKLRGYNARRFSFNVSGGRCEACEGNGQQRIEMHFLPDVWVPCETCGGRRYKSETLRVTFHGKSIADVLEMTCGEAVQLFENVPRIRRILQTLCDVGLDYLTLGQSAPTLSGGEAQRVKLAAELARPDTGRTLYLLDEPTTGLHFDDLAKLLDVLQRLVDMGNTVVAIEHNLDVCKQADWMIDMGPEAGEGGGLVVACGTPEQIVAAEQERQKLAKRKGAIPAATRLVSYTAQALAPVLAAGPYVVRQPYQPPVVPARPEKELEIEQIGDSIAMPWELDGRLWHTKNRVDRAGEPVHWDGQILEWVVDRIQELGDFSETNWNSRSVVEITGPVKSHGWFFHALTGDGWLLKMRFRVRKGQYNESYFEDRFQLKTLNEVDEIPRYGNESRVKLRSIDGPWEEVEMQVWKLEEIDTLEFWEFLEEAAKSFLEEAPRAAQNVDEHMPWKKLGRKWHFLRKGFPPGRTIEWEPSVLEQVVELLQEIAPQAHFTWTNQTVIRIDLEEDSQHWAGIQSKRPDAVLIGLSGPKNRILLGRIAELGWEPELDQSREDADIVKLKFRSAADLARGDLRQFLSYHLQIVRSERS